MVFWRGPAPWFFVAVPPKQSRQIQAIAKQVTYGWGCVPCNVTVGKTDFYTALFPKDGGYLVPIKADVRRREQIDEGDTVTARIEIIEAK